MYCRVLKNPPLIPVLSQINADHTISFYFSNLLSSHLHLGLPSGLFHSGFPTKTICTFLSSLMHTACPAHILLDMISLMTRVIRKVTTVYFGYHLEKNTFMALLNFKNMNHICWPNEIYNEFWNGISLKQFSGLLVWAIEPSKDLYLERIMYEKRGRGLRTSSSSARKV
jgi:hypothetical protein